MVDVGRGDEGGLAAWLAHKEPDEERDDYAYDADCDEGGGPGCVCAGEGDGDLGADGFADVDAYVEYARTPSDIVVDDF